MNNTLLVAKWEVLRSKSKFSMKLAISSIILAAIVVFFFFSVISSEATVTRNIYSLALIGEDPVMEAAVILDGRFKIQEMGGEEAMASLSRAETDIVVFIDDGEIQVYNSRRSKSQGALDALIQSVKRYKLEQIWVVPDDEVKNAFPVWVESHYLEREQEFQYTSLGGQYVEEEQDEAYMTPEFIAQIEDIRPRDVDEMLDELRIAKNRGGGITVGERSVTLPYLLTPPMPFQLVLLTFLLAFPIYLFSQFYSSSMMEEKVNRRVELILASPVKPREIIIGKTLVYFLLCLFTTIGVSVALKQSFDIYIVALSLPIILFFLAISFASAILSRSYKENSFIIVFLSVVFFAYLFFPAMFVNVHVAANISPITLIVYRLQDEAVTLTQYAFSTFPLYFSSLFIFGMGTLIFKEEYLFTQKSVVEKLLDSVEVFAKAVGNPFVAVFLLSAFLIPMVYLAELMFIVLLFQVPYPFSIGAMVVLAALTEEIAKILGISVILSRNRELVTLKNVVTMAFLSSLGFFVVEKGLALITIAQVTQSLFGAVIFLRTLLIYAFIFHFLAVAISAFGIYVSKGGLGWRFRFFFCLAVALHAGYNGYLIRGGLP